MPPDPGVLCTPFTIGTCVTPLSYRLAMGLNNADPVLIQTTTFPLQSQVPSSVTGSLFSHRFPLQSQVPSSVTDSLFSHRFPLQSQVPSSVTGFVYWAQRGFKILHKVHGYGCSVTHNHIHGCNIELLTLVLCSCSSEYSHSSVYVFSLFSSNDVYIRHLIL